MRLNLSAPRAAQIVSFTGPGQLHVRPDLADPGRVMTVDLQRVSNSPIEEHEAAAVMHSDEGHADSLLNVDVYTILQMISRMPSHASVCSSIPS